MKRMRVNQSGAAFNMGMANGGGGMMQGFGGGGDMYNQFGGSGGMNQFADQSGMNGGGMGFMGMGNNGGMAFPPFMGQGAMGAGFGGNMGGGMGVPQGGSMNFGGMNQFGGGTVMPAVPHSNAPTNRTLYLGNLPQGVTFEEVINPIKNGALEQVRLLEDKNCAFITFVEASCAFNQFVETQSKPILIRDQEVRVNWGKPSFCHPSVLNAYHTGATRNVYIGNLTEDITEDVLRNKFAEYGPIDKIKFSTEKNCAFVHLTSLSSAIKAVANLPSDPIFNGKKINYGKDRCNPNNLPPVPVAGMNMGMGDPMVYQGLTQPAMRTLYLGGVAEGASLKEICDAIRGGIVERIKYVPEKSCAFVSFVDPTAAVTFHSRGNNEGVVIKSKRVKVAWGNKATTVPSHIAAAIANGATRNVYIGNIDESVSEDRLRLDFGSFGEIETINILMDKNIAFVAFTDIGSALKAVDAMRVNPEYSMYRINYGKDRCAMPFRDPVVRMGGMGAPMVMPPMMMGMGGMGQMPMGAQMMGGQMMGGQMIGGQMMGGQMMGMGGMGQMGQMPMMGQMPAGDPNGGF
ncbi:hypothetical protein HDV05_000009 [Chytridiales sp. JEL 0842]|nr:hypothetical protein HDV05_000009 [Chytridiales sp. JEL 0842]